MTTSQTAIRQSPYRWVILTLAWAAFTMTSVDRATWGPAAGSVGEDLGVAVAGLGLFATTYYIGYVLSNLFGGFLADWLGGRLIVGTSILLSGSFMLAFGESSSQQWGLVFQACIGLCAGAEFGGGVRLISNWFRPEQRGTAMGIFMTATSLGLVIANAVVPSLIQQASWRASYHLFGFISIGLGIVCLVFLRGRGRELQGEPQETTRPQIRPLLRNKNLILLGLAGFGALWGTYGFITWSNLLMTKGIGIDPVQAGIVVVIFGSAAIFSKPLIGFISDVIKMTRRNLIIIILLAFSATLVLFSMATNSVQFIWIAPLLGMAAYIYSPVMLAMVPTLAGEKLAGSAAGGVNAFWQLGSTIVPTVIGMVFGATSSFQLAFLALAAGPLLAIIPMLAIRPTNATSSQKVSAATSHPVR